MKMMMKKELSRRLHRLWSVAAAFTLGAVVGTVFSCSKEELDMDKLNLLGDPKPVTASAHLIKPVNTDKTTVSNTGKVRWESSDHIIVNGSELSIERMESDSVAVFSGNVGAISGTNGYGAIYPTTLNPRNFNSASATVTLPSSQTDNGNRIPNYMAAYTTSSSGANMDLHFKNLCSIMKIPVKAANGISTNEATLSRIEISATGTNTALSGAATVNWNNGSPTLTCSGSNTLTLNCGNANISTQDTFYVMIPAGNRNLNIRFYNADGKFMQKTLTGRNFERNKIYTTGIVTMNATELPGQFSVSGSTKVRFSQGNLQWSAKNGGSTNTTHAVAGGGTKAGTWRFAEHQYDIIGSSNSNISSSYSGWIDLFGWGTSGYNYKNPYMTSTDNENYGNNSDISGTNYDWGRFNAISNGGNQPGQWRTLTRSEWVYLFQSRSNASSKWGLANVNNVSGVVLLPDTWTLPSGLTFNNGANNGYNRNSYTASEWQRMEANGAVFLPAAGYRNGTNISDAGTTGYYWLGTRRPTVLYYNAHAVTVSASGLSVSPTNSEWSHYDETRCNRGQSVRLVQNVN